MTDVRQIVKQDIEALLGITGVGTDFIVDEKERLEAVAIFEWSNPRPAVTGGGSWHYLQIQVRSEKMQIARDTITRILQNLDSGDDEKQFHPPDYVIYRPRRGAFLMERSSKSITYSGELSVWCND